jgi:hypothetical protein
MATINTLKADNDLIIRQQTAVASINTDEVADRYDVIADELLVRGVANVPTTAAMSTLSGNNFRLCIVKNNGVFEWLASGAADGTNIFTASGGGVWSRVSRDSTPPAIALDSLTDVIITVPAPGDTLEFNGTEWVNVVKMYNPNSSVDFDFGLPNDRMVAVIMIELTANIVAFQISTSPGAGDVVPAQPLLLSAAYYTFPVYLFTGAGTTLHFEGVTSQIYTKIFML